MTRKVVLPQNPTKTNSNRNVVLTKRLIKLLARPILIGFVAFKTSTKKQQHPKIINIVPTESLNRAPDGNLHLNRFSPSRR